MPGGIWKRSRPLPSLPPPPLPSFFPFSHLSIRNTPSLPFGLVEMAALAVCPGPPPTHACCLAGGSRLLLLPLSVWHCLAHLSSFTFERKQGRHEARPKPPFFHGRQGHAAAAPGSPHTHFGVPLRLLPG